MSPCQLKNQLTSFADDFNNEQCSFQKCVIIHDYMDFIFNKKALFALIDKSIKELPLQLAIAFNHEEAVYEAEYFETDLDFINNDWLYYIFLNNVYQALKYFKHAPENRKIELKTNIEKAFNKKHSNQIFKIAINVFNDKLFTLLNQSGFISGDSKIKYLDDDSKVLYSYNEVSQIGVLEILDNKIQFEKDRALMIDFFYKSRTLEDKSRFKTYREFNKKYCTKMNSNAFRQNISDINKRIQNDSKGLISQLIGLEEKYQNDESYFLIKRDNIITQISKNKQKQDKLLNSYLSELISQEVYESKAQEFKKDELILENQLKNLKKDDNGYATLELVKNSLKTACLAGVSFTSLRDIEKEKVLNKLLWNCKIEN